MNFVYTLSDPRNDSVRYVGITERPDERFHQHVTEKTWNERKIAWIQDLKSDNLEPLMKIIEQHTSRSKTEERERYWINFYYEQGADLVNRTNNPATVYVPYERKKEVCSGLHKLRKQKGFTQSELATLVGVLPQTISNAENGISCPQPRILRKLAEVLDVVVDQLFDEPVA